VCLPRHPAVAYLFLVRPSTHMSKPKVFISHITEEGELAELLKEQFLKDFLGMVDVFVSSDRISISVGSKWLNEIDDALKAAHIELILCSHHSIKRPWVNFEAGAGWVKGIPVVPVCHTGMRPVDLPIPLNMLEAIDAGDRAGLERLYKLLASKLGSEVPTVDFTGFISRVRAFEHDYGLVREVSSAVKSILKLLPDLEQIFRPQPLHKAASGDVPELVLDKMRPHLDALQSRGILVYATGSNKIVFGSSGGGNVIELKIQVHDSYYAIASKVLAQ
jgi:TIR domain